MTTAQVVAPVAEAFLRINGDPTLGMPVEHIAFRGLAFRYAQYILPPGGHCDGQAAASIQGAIQAHGARHVAIEDCEIAHLGTYAVWFWTGCRDCTYPSTATFTTSGAGRRADRARLGEQRPD